LSETVETRRLGVRIPRLMTRRFFPLLFLRLSVRFGSLRLRLFLRVWPVPAQTQMTFKLYNPTTKKTVWRSLSATGFTVDPKDGRSCKTNEYVRSDE